LAAIIPLFVLMTEVRRKIPAHGRDGYKNQPAGVAFRLILGPSSRWTVAAVLMRVGGNPASESRAERNME
jgi:hypothetical protein